MSSPSFLLEAATRLIPAAAVNHIPELKQTGEYLQKHHIPHLLQILSDNVILAMPADPTAFLIQQLQDLKAGKAQPMFSVDDLEGIFTTIDVAGKGTISAEQYGQAMAEIGVDEFADPAPGPTVDVAMFRQLGERALKKRLAAVAGR